MASRTSCHFVLNIACRASILVAVFMTSYGVRADATRASTCSTSEFYASDPYKHYLVRLAHLRKELNQQDNQLDLDELDRLLLDTIVSLKEIGCIEETTLNNLKTLKRHFVAMPVGSEKLSQRFSSIFAELGV